MLDELSESRPLAKMQEQLEKEVGPSSETDTTTAGEADDSAANEQTGGDRDERSTTPPGSPSQPRKPLLNPNDGELKRVGSVSLLGLRLHPGHADIRYYPGYTEAGTRSTTVVQIRHQAPPCRLVAM